MFLLILMIRNVEGNKDVGSASDRSHCIENHKAR